MSCAGGGLYPIIGAKVVFESLNVEQRLGAALCGPGAWTKGREGGSGIFSSNQSFIFLGNRASRLVPDTRTGSLAWIIPMIFPIFLFFSSSLVTTVWEQADRSRAARCQYRLQKSISSQTGSEIRGGSYRFLRLFLVSFWELVWFKLVRYYFELGWDKHFLGVPDVHCSLPVARGSCVGVLGGEGMSRKGIGMRE